MKMSTHTLIATVALASTSAFTYAADQTTKDIVLERVISPVVSVSAPSPAVVGDAMAVSVLLELADGTLTPKSTNTVFQTGDRFRIKLIASRDAKVSLYNTNPKGETSQKPIWQGEMKVGLDTISPRLKLEGNSGVDLLHIVMEPAQQESVFAWLESWLRSLKSGPSSKDIRLDVQNTPSTSYLLNGQGQGLVSTMSIVHKAR